MWPKRKILILTPQGSEEGLGFQALLKALEIETILRQISPEEPLDLTGLTIPEFEAVDENEDEDEDFPDYGPTEIIYWPEFEVQNAYRQWGETRGLFQESVVDFLHRLWEQEVILPVFERILEKERPLLWKLLSEEGYEPSLLWCGVNRQWVVEKGRGVHWVVPGNWLAALVKDNPIGRPFKGLFPEAGWVICDAYVDFYAERKNFRYLGRLPRYPDPEVEVNIYHSIQWGLQLGVSWREVKKNIRWNVDGVEGNQGANRAECFFEDPEYVEDRRSG